MIQLIKRSNIGRRIFRSEETVSLRSEDDRRRKRMPNVVRMGFWLARKEPPEKGWNMDKEKLVWDYLIGKGYGSGELLGAYDVMRECLRDRLRGKPVTGKIFLINNYQHLHDCMQYWREKMIRSKPAPFSGSYNLVEWNDLGYWRGETAVIIRKDFWLGGTPPPVRGRRKWSMDRELSVFTYLSWRMFPAELHGIYSVMRAALKERIPPSPVTGLIFVGEGNWWRVQECYEYWQNQQTEKAMEEFKTTPSGKELMDKLNKAP